MFSHMEKEFKYALFMLYTEDLKLIAFFLYMVFDYITQTPDKMCMNILSPY